MRKIRILSIIIFVISAGIFAFYKVADKKTADTKGPVIHMDKTCIEVSVKAGNDELLDGVTASDDRDGDVTASLVIEKLSKFTDRGKRTATLAAFDSDNHVTKAEREMIYSDYEPPVFALEEPLYFPVNGETLTGALTVTDVLDGDLTSNIKVSAEQMVRTSTSGDYPVIFSISNSSGDTVHLPVTVTLYDPSEFQALPHITLSAYLIYVKKGERVDAWSYIDEVTYRGRVYVPEKNSEGKNVLAEEIKINGSDVNKGQEETGQGYEPGRQTAQADDRKYLTDIDITGTVDTDTPGTYEIMYKVTANEAQKFETGTMRLIIVVTE